MPFHRRRSRLGPHPDAAEDSSGSPSPLRNLLLRRRSRAHNTPAIQRGPILRFLVEAYRRPEDFMYRLGIETIRDFLVYLDSEWSCLLPQHHAQVHQGDLIRSMWYRHLCGHFINLAPRIRTEWALHYKDLAFLIHDFRWARERQPASPQIVSQGWRLFLYVYAHPPPRSGYFARWRWRANSLQIVLRINRIVHHWSKWGWTLDVFDERRFEGLLIFVHNVIRMLTVDEEDSGSDVEGDGSYVLQGEESGYEEDSEGEDGGDDDGLEVGGHEYEADDRDEGELREYEGAVAERENREEEGSESRGGEQ